MSPRKLSSPIETPVTNGKKQKRTTPKADAEDLPHGLGKSLVKPHVPAQDEVSKEKSESTGNLELAYVHDLLGSIHSGQAIELVHLCKLVSSIETCRLVDFIHPKLRFKLLSHRKDGIKSSSKVVTIADLLPETWKSSPESSAGKKSRPKIDYNHRFGETPFPGLNRPTPEECRVVNDLLTVLHGEKQAPAAIPPPSRTFAGCGETKCPIDAVIRTLISANTRGDSGSALAIKGMFQTFGATVDGEGREKLNWDFVHRSPLEKVVEAIRGGGNQNEKGKRIKDILNMVFLENSIRRKALADPAFATKMGFDNESVVQQSAKISCANPEMLSLDHLRGLSYHQVFYALLKYPGIALKTASCVSLYCFQRPSFAVDTHVHRITGWLGWRPDKANPDKTFSHLEYMIPDELKYSLHTLFVLHGKECVRCQSKTHDLSPGWDEGCPIDHLVKRIKNHEVKKAELAAKGTSLRKEVKTGKKVDKDGDEGEEEYQAASPAKRKAAQTVLAGRVVKTRATPKAEAAPQSVTKVSVAATPYTKTGETSSKSDTQAREATSENEEEVLSEEYESERSDYNFSDG